MKLDRGGSSLSIGSFIIISVIIPAVIAYISTKREWRKFKDEVNEKRKGR